MAPTRNDLCDISAEDDGEEGEEEVAEDVLVVDALVGSGSLTLAESNTRSVPVLWRTNL
jgi:hypothetical protein